MNRVLERRRLPALVLCSLLLAATLAIAAAAPPVAAAAGGQKLTVADGDAHDHFGGGAIDGDTAAIGAPGADAGRGAIYVFQRSGDSWLQTARLTASDGEPASGDHWGDQLGSSVAIDGDTIVAGAIFDDIGANRRQGSAYTFARTGATERTETAKLTASEGNTFDHFGYSVAIDGDTIVAGVPYYYDGRSSGSVYTFARTGSSERSESAKLTLPLPVQKLGESVAIDGETIVAGAPYTRVGDYGLQGAVYTFARTDAAQWTKTARLTATDGAPRHYLGGSVAVDGETIVAGGYGEIGTSGYRGFAYTFDRTGAPERSESAKLTAGTYRFGSSVAIDGETIVAGAPGDTANGQVDAGSAYTFARTAAAQWAQTARLTALDPGEGDAFGSPVALEGDTVLVGATLDDIGANEAQGSAWVFTTPPHVPPATPPPGAPATRPSGAVAPPLYADPVSPRALKAGACANKRRGTNGGDTLLGTPAGDEVLGLAGSDRISGLAGADCLFGGAGADRLAGDAGSDRLQGEGGADVMSGGAEPDRLLGGRGNDRLAGGDGNDRLAGGPGNDKLTGSRGRNSYSAGTGNDTVNGRNRKRERVDCGPGHDTAIVDRLDRLRRCERVKRR